MLAATAAWPAVAAPAAPPLRPIGTASGPVATDGARFLVVPVASPHLVLRRGQAVGAGRSIVRVRDDATGRWRRVVGPRGFCRQAGVGGGQLLWDCGAPGAPLPRLSRVRLRRLDLRTGRTHLIPNVLRLYTTFQAPAAYTFGAIGARWVVGQRIAPGTQQSRFFLAWRTGAVRQATPDATSVIDLDAARPVVGLCPGLSSAASNVRPYQYAPPFGLATKGDAAALTPFAPARPVTLQLDHCGRGRHVRLARCACYDAQLSAGVVTWSARGVAHAYVAATGRRLQWSLGRRLATIAHTAHQVVVTVAPATPTGRWRVLAAAI
jgi:hypothetical protein